MATTLGSSASPLGVHIGSGGGAHLATAEGDASGVVPSSSSSVSATASGGGGGGGSTSSNTPWILSSSLSSTAGGTTAVANAELDERLVAKAALDAAEDALESLCATHAGTFVAVEKRGQQMEQALRDLESVISRVRSKVQVAQAQVWQAQSEEGEEIQEDGGDEGENVHNNNNKMTTQKIQSLAVLSERHRVRRRTLLQHSALLELLELPSLMDACVRSNLYEEALNIASLANSLERRRGSGGTAAEANDTSAHSSKVVSHVVAQIRNRQEDLRRHLLHRLQGSVTMPDCLEVVTALRRLNSIDLELSQSNNTTATAATVVSAPQDSSSPETQQEHLYRAMEVKMQIDFLEARDVWLDSTTATNSSPSTQSSSSSSSASSEDLLDTIERYRTRVFEIATQFNAIFRANNPGVTSTTTSSTAGTTSLSFNQMTSSADLLSLWACRRIQAFLQILQQGISNAAAAADATGAGASVTGTKPPTTAADITSNRAQQQQQMLVFGAANLRDLLEATVFFASSMGRLGADFSAHWIPDIFENALVDWIVHHCWIQQGVKPLHEVWAICQQVNVAAPLVASGTSSSTGSSGRGAASSAAAMVVYSNPNAEEVEQLFHDFVVPASGTSLLEQPLAPPRVLMQVPPLGRFVNAVLLGLNELRRCLLPSALPRLEQALEEEILQVVSQELKRLERQLITAAPARGGSSHQKDNLKMFREVISLEYMPIWNQIVIPYCRGSLWTAMGRGSRALEDYQLARQAMDTLIQEKKDASAALMEKQKQEVVAVEVQVEDENGQYDGGDTTQENDQEDGAADATETSLAATDETSSSAPHSAPTESFDTKKD